MKKQCVIWGDHLGCKVDRGALMHFTFASFAANESDTRFTGEGTGK